MLSSDREGTPNVVMEAMACGLPVIATNVGEVSALVQDGQTGYLVEPGSSEAIVDKLQILMGNRELRMKMGAAGRAFIVDNYSVEHLYENLMVLYQSIL